MSHFSPKSPVWIRFHPDFSKKIGRLGEEYAIEYLKKLGYKILCTSKEFTNNKHYDRFLTNVPKELHSSFYRQVDFIDSHSNNIHHSITNVNVLSSIDLVCINTKRELVLIEVKSKIFNPKERLSHRTRFELNSSYQKEAMKLIFKYDIKFELVVVYFDKNSKVMFKEKQLVIEKYDKKELKLAYKNNLRYITIKK